VTALLGGVAQAAGAAMPLAVGAAPAVGAARALGAGERSFVVTHEYKVARTATVFVPMPSDDPWQTVRALSVESTPATAWERVYDPRWGNAVRGCTQAAPPPSPCAIP
jgi:hypothetical protein